MPLEVVTFSFVDGNPSAYITDFGESISLSRLCRIPPDLTDTDVSTIATAIGAEILPGDVGCPDDIAGADARYLCFTRRQGGTFTVPFRLRSDIINVANTVRGILDSTAGNEVVCIDLMGEEFGNVNDIFGVNFSGTNFAPTHVVPDTAPRQFYLTGNFSYQADGAATPGAGTLARVRSITNVQDAPATKFGTAFQDCVGDLLTTISCPQARRAPRTTRRYNLQFATRVDLTDLTETPQPESNEVPVAAFSATDIRACGDALAALDGLFCMGYRGESYRGLHRLL